MADAAPGLRLLQLVEECRLKAEANAATEALLRAATVAAGRNSGSANDGEGGGTASPLSSHFSSEFIALGKTANEEDDSDGAAHLFAAAFVLLPRVSTLFSFANMRLKKGRVHAAREIYRRVADAEHNDDGTVPT
ncbi:hypothetical protein EMIHUDRAFT_202455 [Emiliania huxleyi CCMP1516]|uniref:Uncharacterized protein n=2 Tax=Emiliania huxleyi TaxID=2903 RepID=A0A0D3KBS8_EMIH1|nr:hypothetical protein EMIHUDRAFT_198701 [Emiliania huxleyi CCMP1516]XP_005785642.1 hypothetical protein EMIHUDRAFT_202455 [Emiliania huxleyi CCMP1516]EOD07291.1 hypothetical protein EMIHUDRAFT_198701 [Emiliania huxleyi CCMP1516]EOD33213.1 hypothetical protein EMIHUDRAFT_202455 [Emiliania huxleyi CCMP1516]|eukprot:XP_005759720.1 hypothetical protein EMIHUDRAFT_198701 [Emiliania huxleyi CCMP1516]